MFGSRLEVKKFEEDVKKYEARPVETGKILFYGHSLYTRTSFIYCDRHPEKGHPLLEEAVRMKDGSQAIVNHGFGTSSADDLLYYSDRLVRPYAPRALFLVIGGNDMGFGYSASEIMNVMATLIAWFKADFPGAPVYWMGRTPTLKRKGVVDGTTRRMVEFQEYVEDYCAKKEGVTYVPLNEAPCYFEKPEDIGDIDKIWDDLFDTDQVHLNKLGYERFMDYIRDLLEKEGLLG